MIDRGAAQRYREQGFLGPLRLCTPEQMACLRPYLDEVLATPGWAPAPSEHAASGRLSRLLTRPGGVNPVPWIECRHLDSAIAHRLATHPCVLEACRALYGPDLVLWRSTFIDKHAGGVQFSWHQDWGGPHRLDEDAYGLEPPLAFTVWIAIDEATESNGCLQFVAGSRKVRAGVPTSDDPRAILVVDPGDVPRVPMPLQPGEFVIFTDRVVHGSAPNTTRTGRLAYSLRLSIPLVRVRTLFDRHRVMLVSGRDHVGVNELGAPPPSTGLAALVPAAREALALPVAEP